MSSFFSTGGSGSSSGSNSNANGTGSSGAGGGGWGSFLKQGLSTIESKLDMVLDMQVPIPGGASALTSYSPHASVLPSVFTPDGSNSGKEGGENDEAPRSSTAAGQDDSEEINGEEEQGKEKRSSVISTKSSAASSIRHKSSTQDMKRTSSQASVRRAGEDSSGKFESSAVVTVDPFTGMITTTPGITRMATPPISGVSIASAASSTMSAAAAAAAANRERLEQRMRGIFKKSSAETAPTTPTPSTTAVSSPVQSPSPSVSKVQEKESSGPETNTAEAVTDNITVAKNQPSLDVDASPAAPTADDSDAKPALDITVQEEPKSEDTKDSAVTTTEVEKKGPIGEDTISEQSKVNTKPSSEIDLEAMPTQQEEVAEDPRDLDHEQKEPAPVKEPLSLEQPVESEESNQESSTQIPEAKAEAVLDTPTRSESATPTPVTPTEVDPSYTPKISTELEGAADQSEHLSTTTATTVTSESSTTKTAELASAAELAQVVAVAAPTKSSGLNAQPKSVLEQREEQLFKTMQEQSSLLERLRDLEDAKAAEDSVQATKIAGLERIIENQKKELEVARASNLDSQPKSIQKTLEEQRALLEEKDEQIRGLLAEGEVLSKKEFKNLTSIKTLRTKNIEFEKNQMDLQKKYDRLAAEHADNHARVGRLQDENRRLEDNARSAFDTTQRQAKQISKLESEISQLREDKSSLQLGLDRAWQELAEARKASVELSSQTHAAALDREMKLNEELSEQVNSLKNQHATVESSLRQDIQDLRVSLSNREELAGESEDHLRMEIKNLQYRLEQTDNDSFELQEALDEARRPLLRQIEMIQNQHSAASRNWDKIELTLTRRVTEAEEDVTKAQERERAARDRLDEVKSQNIALEARLETLRIADTQLRSEVNSSKRMVIEKEEASRQAQAELSRERVNRERAVEEAKADVERKWRLLQQAEAEKHKAQIQQLSSLSSQRATAAEDEVLLLSAVPRKPTSSSSTNHSSMNVTTPQSEQFPRTSFDSLKSPISLDGMPPLLSRTSSSQTMTGVASTVSSTSLGLASLGGSHSTGPAVAIERLNTMVRQLEGQVSFLTEQVRSTNKNKDDLSDELVRVTMELEELQQVASRVPGLEQELTLLQQRHKAALEMLGERTEEVEELKADIADVKEAYRDQINELLSQLEKSRRR